MKKTLFLMMSLGTLSMAKTAVEVRIGGDLSSEGKFKEVYNYIENKVIVPEQKNVIKNGFELAGEVRTGGDLELGVGIAYRGSKLKGLENVFSTSSDTNLFVSENKKGTLSSVPLYLTARYNFRAVPGITPYVKANLGYSFNSGKNALTIFDSTKNKDVVKEVIEAENGIYYGIGGGIQVAGFVVDLTYNVNTVKINRSLTTDLSSSLSYSDKFKANNGILTLGIGYTFGF